MNLKTKKRPNKKKTCGTLGTNLSIGMSKSRSKLYKINLNYLFTHNRSINQYILKVYLSNPQQSDFSALISLKSILIADLEY
jgi:hypothetical protein